MATHSANTENISKKSPQTVDFFECLNIIKINRTQHASQRCGPRWVILILWEMVFKMEHSVFHFVKECIISVRMLYHVLLVRPPTLKQAVIHGQNCSKFAHLPTNQRRSNKFPKESFYIPVRPCYNISRWTKIVSFGRGQKGRDTRSTSQKS